jgi:hypothetical protein
MYRGKIARLLFTGLVAALFVPSVAKADWRAFEAYHERCWPKTQRYQFGAYTCKGQKAVNVYNTMEDDGRFLRDFVQANDNGHLYRYRATGGSVTSCGHEDIPGVSVGSYVCRWKVGAL